MTKYEFGITNSNKIRNSSFKIPNSQFFMSLYSDFFYSKDINNLLSERQLIAQMLRFEGALALAQANNNIISPQLAEIINAHCDIAYIDFDKLKSEIKLGGNAAIPLVKQLTRIVKNNDVEASKYVHLGATSQDVVDTATVLIIKEYIVWLEDKLQVISELMEDLITKHRATLMIGRTLLQQARPITFGLKLAYWLTSIKNAETRLNDIKNRLLVIQLVGAVGSGNANISIEVQQHVCEILALKHAYSWQSGRENLTEFAASIGILNQSLGKIARDISLLMQTEVGEVFEGAGEGKGGSSTMPHKRNPVTCAAIIANSTRIPHLVGSKLSAMLQEHERSAGLWHAEWEVLTDILGLTAGSVERMIELLTGLEVDEKRMLANLELTKGLIYAENVSFALSKSIGKMQAHELIEKACKQAVAQNKHLKEVLKEMNVEIDKLDELFMPENSIGNSLGIIDEIIKNL